MADGLRPSVRQRAGHSPPFGRPMDARGLGQLAPAVVSAKVTVPPGTSSGRKLALRGRGLPNPKGKPGDLFAEVRIMVPPKLSEEERRLFEELGKTASFDPRSTRDTRRQP